MPLSSGVDAHADALKSLMKDADLRARLGAAARAKASTYIPSVIARRYLDLIEGLRPEPPSRPPPNHARPQSPDGPRPPHTPSPPHTPPIPDITVPVHNPTPAHFRFTIPYAEAQSHHGTADHTVWDLHVHTTAGRVPLGRITGDTVERKKTNTYPATELPHTDPTATIRLRPYYTATNALSLSARTVPGSQA